jgi:hypothetical protein
MTPEELRRRVDIALYEAVPYRAYTRLSGFRNIDVTNVSKYHDPNNLKYQSVFSKGLLELHTIARPEVSPEWAQNILKVVNVFGVQWCGVPRVSGMTDVVSLTARVFDPETPDTERLPLALRLQDEVNKVIDGLRFENLEGEPSARAR